MLHVDILCSYFVYLACNYFFKSRVLKCSTIITNYLFLPLILLDFETCILRYCCNAYMLLTVVCTLKLILASPCQLTLNVEESLGSPFNCFFFIETLSLGEYIQFVSLNTFLCSGLFSVS